MNIVQEKITEDQEYFHKARLLRDGLRRFTKNSLITHSMNYLRESEKKDLSIPRLPFLALIILEWTLQIEERSQAKNASYEDYLKFIDQLFKLPDKSNSRLIEKDLNLALRRILLPQIWNQRHTSQNLFMLARLYSFFSSSESFSALSKQFKQENNITLEDFFSLSIWLISRTSEANNNIIPYQRIIIELYPSFSLEVIKSFFSIVGSNINKLTEKLKINRDKSITIDHFYTDSPLFNSPLIYLENEILIPHSFMTSKAISEITLEIFKDKSRDKFREKFTKQFEKYIHKILELSSIDFISEQDIQKNFQKNNINGKVTDFLAREKSGSVFIDAKGIEPNVKVKSTDKANIIKDRLRSSFIHGVRQAYECAGKLEKIDNNSIDTYNNRYVLIVTHTEFYIPNGRVINESIDPNLFSDLIRKNGNTIPLENVYFCCIEDFEGMIKSCDDSGSDLSEFLSRCVDRDSIFSDRKMFMRQHLEDFCVEKNLGYSGPIGSEIVLNDINRKLNSTALSIEGNLIYWKRGGTRLLNTYLKLLRQITNNLSG